MSKLVHGSKIGNAIVISNDILSKGTSIPGRTLASIGYITMHNTGLVDVKANNFHRSLKRENALTNGRKASWTFTVDDIEIYQETPMNWETWHAGNSTGNKNSISIEMCQWSDKEKQRKTYDNAARLVAKIMKQYKLSIDKVVQHNKWSGKNCPEYLRAKKYGYDWNWFISLVKKYYNETTASNDTKKVNGTITILVDSLNVRKDADFNSSVLKTIKKGTQHKVVELKNGLYNLSTGGWCSAGEKYVKFEETKESTSDSTYIVDTDVLNVRSGRGIEFNKVGSLKRGEKITIWSVAKDNKGNDWGSFRYSFNPDIIGYVSMTYLKKE